MDDSQQKTVSEKLAQLQAAYLEHLPNDLSALQALGESLYGGECDRAGLDMLHQQLHKLAGAGGTFGCANLSAAAGTLERRIGRWLNDDLASLDSAARRALVEDLAALRTTVDDVEPARQSITMPSAGFAANETVWIWLVEDDAELGRQLMYQLESFNYRVRRFERIEEAECAAQEDQPDLVIMDVIFESEEKNATIVLTQYPALTALNCPLLFITAHDDFSSRVRAVQLGAKGYFLKPLDMPRVVNHITHIFDQRRAPPQRVLIVDDDADIAEHIRLVLLAANIDAEVLQAPQDIMQEIAAFRPELVLMDLHMPEFSGPDLAGVIRQHDRYANLPIVYLSAETDIEQQMQAMEQGADDFLNKPISDLQLVAAARSRIARARELEERISKDSLTGLLKHGSIKEAANQEVLRARRIDRPVTLAMLDIDHFKVVNDTYGHAVGDTVISSISTLLRQRLRQSDSIGRYGGEEFVAVLPECEAEYARQLLDDIRQRFSSLRYNHEQGYFNCTISVGLACSAQYPDSNGTELLVTADKALYKAKRSGRNQVREARPA